MPEIGEIDDSVLSIRQKRREIPWGWAEVVCSCDDPKYPAGRFGWRNGPDDKPELGNTACVYCGKLPRFFILDCTGCGETYDYQFLHHANVKTSDNPWALDKRLCWNCITSKDPATENDRPPLYTEAPRKARSMDELALDTISFDFD